MEGRVGESTLMVAGQGRHMGRELQLLVAHGHSDSGRRIGGSTWKERMEDMGLWTCVCFHIRMHLLIFQHELSTFTLCQIG